MSSETINESPKQISPTGLRMVGWAALIAAAAHILALLIGLFSPSAILLGVIGVVLALTGWGLIRTWKWPAWFAFLAALLGGLSAFGALGGSTVPDVFLYLVLAVDVVAATMLLIHLWRRP